MTDKITKAWNRLRGQADDGRTLDVLVFQPPEVDHNRERAAMDAEIAKLGKKSLDEATPHPVDNYLNAREEQWLAAVNGAYADYQPQAGWRIGESKARLARLRTLYQYQRRRANDLRRARNLALMRIFSGGTKDPSLIAGRGWAELIYLGVLVIAAVADLVAFVQVLETLMPLETSLRQTVLVTGFTVIALFLAHSVGILVKKKRRWGAGSCFVAWLALGLVAAWVRLSVGSKPVAGGGFRAQSDAGADQANPAEPTGIIVAAIFLGLYIGSGLAAMIGAYFAHESEGAAYRRILRAEKSAIRRCARWAMRYAREIANLRAQIEQRQAAKKRLDDAQDDLHALSAELKQRARIAIAAILASPSSTDAVLEDDRRPHTFRWPPREAA
ncbi:hypothetical protein DMH04_49625 [Kibdelosporangium aridum]|uniref:Uncharacterized protein n=1 Tax=Kibdelosporangium aridum TaxID=2030 RepID=A0A428YCF5_KIBAR|nr:hypothetical protein [Kibdelosporangium aridum]RSM65238.1 hypothetical protein DMH04_49625 [Kibdelosporangium aridum]